MHRVFLPTQYCQRLSASQYISNIARNRFISSNSHQTSSRRSQRSRPKTHQVLPRHNIVNDLALRYSTFLTLSQRGFGVNFSRCSLPCQRNARPSAGAVGWNCSSLSFGLGFRWGLHQQVLPTDRLDTKGGSNHERHQRSQT